MAQQSSITTSNGAIPVTTSTAAEIINLSKYPLNRCELRLDPEKSRSANIISDNDSYLCNINNNNNNNRNDNINDMYYNPIYNPNDYHYLPVKNYFSVDHFNRLLFETPQRRATTKCYNHRKQNLMNQSFKYWKLISTKTQQTSPQKLYSFDLLSKNSKELKATHSFECILHQKNMSLCIWDSMLKQKDESYRFIRQQHLATMTDACICFNSLNNDSDSDNDDVNNDDDNVDDDDVGDMEEEEREEDDDENDSILSEYQHFNKSKISWYNENDDKHQLITSHYEESRIDRAKFMASAAEKLLTADRNMKEAQRFSISHPRTGRTRSLFNLFLPRKFLSMEISNPILISSTKSTDYLRCLPEVQTIDNGFINVRIL